MTDWSHHHPFEARLLESRHLHPEGAAKDTRHIEIDLSGSGISYIPGDSLGVVPSNCPDLVAGVLAATGFAADTAVEVGDTTTSFGAVLASHQISLVPKAVAQFFAERSGDAQLTELLGNRRELSEFVWGLDLQDMAERYRCDYTAQDLVAALRPIQPRLYSIASSIAHSPDQVHLTVGVVTFDAHGRQRKGVASTWLSDRVGVGGTVPCYIHESKKFRLPSDPSTPIIMVGPGTGIAPFRSFLHQRKIDGASGDNWLFFGNPHRASDFLYEGDDFTSLASEHEHGLLTRLDLAFSRDQADKLYVQHRMLEQAAELWAWLDRGAHFYVCGDAKRMAKDVDAALHTILAEQGGFDADGVKAYLKQMKADGRYQRDVYAV